jgi:hypothetical protein
MHTSMPHTPARAHMRFETRVVTHWVKIVAGDGRYRTFRARGDLGTPEWPEDLDRNKLLSRTFQEQMIGDRDHELVKQYLGLKRR